MLQVGVIVLVMLLISSLLVAAMMKRELNDNLETKKRVMEKLHIKNLECGELRAQIAKYQKERDTLEQTLTSDAVEYFEEELQHIGAEIHDDLIQRLTEHRFTVEKLGFTDDLAELQAMGLRLKNEFKTIVLAVRRISERTLPDNLVIGSFTNSIRSLCERMEAPGTLTLHFESSGKESPISSDHSLHIYRIVQELIHNTIKHSLAWHLWVRVNWGDGLEIQLEDDGRKDNIEEAIRNLSSFRSIRLRALKTGSQILFSKAKQGLRITIRYDVKNKLVESPVIK